MGKNIIVSEETVRDLLEAHASLSAWYYELTNALRAARGVARTPDDAMRSAFVERLVQDFPELSAIAKQIGVPRQFVPPPPVLANSPESGRDEQSTLIEPAQARARHSSPAVDPVSPGSVVPPSVVPPKPRS